VSPERLEALAGDTDSEVLFALVLDHLDAGLAPDEALSAAIDAGEAAAAGAPGRLNLLLCDGTSAWASSWGNSLFVRDLPGGGRVVASEPWDDDGGWTAVPDRTVLAVGAPPAW
jgi:glutamine amidotransferase